MKIGILTYHAVSNFGAQLQVYSTVSYLRNKGYTPVVIHWYPDDLANMYKKMVGNIQTKEHADFVIKNLPVTSICKSELDIINTVNKYQIDGLIIGSDAVLNYQSLISRVRLGIRGLHFEHKYSNRRFPNPFWGTFIESTELKKIPIVMMSVSAQDSDYKHVKFKLRKNMFKALSRVNFITVRDSWTRNMIKYLTYDQIIPDITPDPVFGFNYNNEKLIPSKEYILEKFGLPDNYILLSFKNYSSGVVSLQWLNDFDKKARSIGCVSVALCMPGGVMFENNFDYKIDVPLSPLDWYALIKYSKGYIGHNMHPIVVSLHNVVPFYSFDNYGIVRMKYFVKDDSSKIYHILKEADLLKNRCSALGRLKYKEPSVELVFDSIINFEYNKCECFSKKYLNSYIDMMKRIEDVFAGLI